MPLSHFKEKRDESLKIIENTWGCTIDSPNFTNLKPLQGI